MNVKRIIAGSVLTGLMTVGLATAAASPATASVAPTSASASTTVLVPTVKYPKNIMPLADVESRSSFDEQGATLVQTTSAKSGLVSALFSGYDTLGNEQAVLVGYGEYSPSAWKRVIAGMKKKYGAKTVESDGTNLWTGVFTQEGVTGYVSISRTVRGNHITVGMSFQDSSSPSADNGRYIASTLALAQGNYMYDKGL